MSLWSRMTNALRGECLSREIDDEYQSHIQEAIEQGRDPSEARKAFGSALRQRDESHDIRVVAWLDSLRADAIFGWRQLKKNKVTSASAILSLALAIGACTSTFRLIDALLLRPLPVAEPEQLSAFARHDIFFDGTPQTFDGWANPAFHIPLSLVTRFPRSSVHPRPVRLDWTSPVRRHGPAHLPGTSCRRADRNGSSAVPSPFGTASSEASGSESVFPGSSPITSPLLLQKHI